MHTPWHHHLRPQAIKIALELKKYLVDKDIVEIKQVGGGGDCA